MSNLAALEERIKAIDEMQLSATKEKAEAELMQMHPDFDEIRDSDEFHEWAEEQPKWVQDALYENDNDARSAARAIDSTKLIWVLAKRNPSQTKMQPSLCPQKIVAVHRKKMKRRRT